MWFEILLVFILFKLKKQIRFVSYTTVYTDDNNKKNSFLSTILAY